MENGPAEMKLLLLLFRLHHNVKKGIQDYLPESDEFKGTLLILADEGICGIPALITDIGKSTLEWDSNLQLFLRRLPLLSASPSPLVIIGQSGTGKSAMAAAIHKLRGKNRGRFIYLSCSEVSENLLESELFGYKKGAFTGATQNRPGIIEQAKGGTLFIDEIGKAPHAVHSKLLRVIETNTIRPIGAEKDENLGHVKFVFAMQPSDLENKVILPDLINRLNLYDAIRLPSLKDRIRLAGEGLFYEVFEKVQTEWIPGTEKDERGELASTVEKLFKEFESTAPEVMDIPSTERWKRYGRAIGEMEKRFGRFYMSQETVTALATYDGYEGKNFRELENILKSALITARAQNRREILIEDLPNTVGKTLTGANAEKMNGAPSSTDIDKIPLRDILDYADTIKRGIVESKVKSLRSSGRDLKSVLREEGVSTQSGYTNFLNKLRRLGMKAGKAE